eukprot:5943424-Prymnesium_polylepis.1
MQIANGGFSFETARRFVENLDAEMQRDNPLGLAFLRKRLGGDLGELTQAVGRVLRTNENEALVFASHAGDSAMVASMKDLVETMVSRTGRTVKWNEVSKPPGAVSIATRRSLRRSLPKALSICLGASSSRPTVATSSW